MKLLEELEAALERSTPPHSDLLRRTIDELTAQDVTIGNLEALCRELKDRSAHAAPDGWQLVPVEPTAEMWLNGMNETGHYENGEMMLLSGDQTCRIYAAMLKAARGES